MMKYRSGFFVVVGSGLIALVVLVSIIWLWAAGNRAQVAGVTAALVSWQETELRSGEVAEIVISPSDPTIMHAGFEVNSHSLYKSTDGGRSWTKVEGGGDHTKDVAISPQDPNRVYFAMSEALDTSDRSFRSTARSKYGGGPPGFVPATQTILTTGLFAGGSSVSFSSVEVFEGDDRIIYAARKGGPYGFGGEGVKPKIYQTTNRGQTWSETEPNLSTVNVLAIHPQQQNLILIGSRDGLFRSDDAGQTLTKLNQLSGVISIEFQLTDPNTVYAASDAQVIKSTDGGHSWQDITGQLTDIHRVRVSRSHGSVLYASTFNGVLRSDDGGATWHDASGNLGAKNVQVVTIHPTNPDIAFIGHSSLWSAVRAEDRYRTGLLANQGIWRTEDGGRTWVRSDAGIKEYRFEEAAINPTKAYEAWVASPASRGGYKTEDGGHTWRLSQTPTFHYPMRVKYSQQHPDKIYATGWQNNAPFSISQDGGVNWELISERVFFQGLTRGRNMQSGQEAIHLHGLAVDPTNDQIVYVGSVDDAQNPAGFLKGAHLFKSTDGGRTWQESDEGFPHEASTAIHDLTIDPTNTNIIYASTTRHESRQGLGVYKSTDAGAGWQAVNRGLTGEALNVNSLLVHPHTPTTLVIATFGGLFRSDNAGQSWRQTFPARSFDAEYVIDEPATIYAATNQGIMRSSDFGTTWHSVNANLPISTAGGEHLDHSLGVDKTGQVLYAAIDSQGVFVARLADIAPQPPASQFGKNPYSFGPFTPGQPPPWARGPGPGRPNLWIVTAIVAGAFVILLGGIIVMIKILRHRRKDKLDTTRGQPHNENK